MWFACCCTTAAVLIVTTTTRAQSPARSPASENVDRLLQHVQPRLLGANEVRETLLGVGRQLDGLREYLSSQPHGRTWVAYLRLEQLEGALRSYQEFAAAGQGDADEARRLDEGLLTAIGETLDALIGTEAGLERQPLLKMRDAIQAYRVARRLQAEGDGLANAVSEKLMEITSALVVLRRQDDAQAAERLADACGWLARRHQAPQLLAALRDQYSRANLFVSLNGDTINALTEKPVYDVKPINETSNGATIRGQATVVGSVKLYPVQGVYGGELEARFLGYVDSDMHGSKGPVQFNLQGHTNLHVAKRIILTEDQFYVLPATTQASTDLRTGAVCTRFKRLLGKLVRGVARKEIEKQRPEASRELSQQAAEGFLEEFEKELNVELGSAKRDLDLNFTRLGFQPSRFEFHTNNQRLQVRLGLNGDMVVTAAPPPPAQTLVGDVNVTLHQSAINRMFSQIYGGEVLELTELTRQLESGASSDPSSPASGKPASDLPPFTITFAESQPLTAQFAGDRLILRMHGSRFLLDNDVILSGMIAEFVFRITREQDKIVLVREGRPKIEPPPSGRQIRFTLQRPKLRTELDRQLPQRIELASQQLPDELGEKLGRLTISELTAQAGWLQASLNTSP